MPEEAPSLVFHDPGWQSKDKMIPQPDILQLCWAKQAYGNPQPGVALAQIGRPHPRRPLPVATQHRWVTSFLR